MRPRLAARLLLPVLPLLPALGAGRALALDVEILPGGAIREGGAGATVSLRVTCAAQDGPFSGFATIVQGAARGTGTLRGGCAGIGSGVVEALVPADRAARRPPFRPGRARASVRLTPRDPLHERDDAADARPVELR
jgi:hypothetical protein